MREAGQDYIELQAHESHLLTRAGYLLDNKAQ